jgi:hypothetical protein
MNLNLRVSSWVLLRDPKTQVMLIIFRPEHKAHQWSGTPQLSVEKLLKRDLDIVSYIFRVSKFDGNETEVVQ